MNDNREPQKKFQRIIQKDNIYFITLVFSDFKNISLIKINLFSLDLYSRIHVKLREIDVLKYYFNIMIVQMSYKLLARTKFFNSDIDIIINN